MNHAGFWKILLVFIVAYSSSHAAIYFSADRINAAFEGIFIALNFLMPTMLAASWGIFTYVDNMSKELTDLRNDVDRPKYVIAQKALAALKSEIILNAILVFVLFLVDKIVASATAAPKIMQEFSNPWLIGTISLSIRLSFLVIAVVAALIQMRGFITAVEYRTVIAINRK
ncbi:hypothetical protein [Janthinobacterium sp.]|uniref:hypothetical protein n=1 Tax=Janthinobacterium sp. TaxID=1871054 RepID=UPI00261CC6B8|nr:hypothetical protein [Janthinobacterium sp.]